MRNRGHKRLKILHHVHKNSILNSEMHPPFLCPIFAKGTFFVMVEALHE